MFRKFLAVIQTLNKMCDSTSVLIMRVLVPVFYPIYVGRVFLIMVGYQVIGKLNERESDWLNFSTNV